MEQRIGFTFGFWIVTIATGMVGDQPLGYWLGSVLSYVTIIGLWYVFATFKIVKK